MRLILALVFTAAAFAQTGTVITIIPITNPTTGVPSDPGSLGFRDLTGLTARISAPDALTGPYRVRLWDTNSTGCIKNTATGTDGQLSVVACGAPPFSDATPFIYSSSNPLQTLSFDVAALQTNGVLKVAGETVSPIAYTSGSDCVRADASVSPCMLNPMTTTGDMIYGGSSGVPTRLAGPGAGQVLGFNGFLPGWRTMTGSGPIVFTRSTYDFDCPTCVTTSRTIGTTPPLLGGGSLSTDLSLSIQVATAGQNGYLSSTDWSTFNNRMVNPMTTPGDMIYGGTSGAPTRLGGPGAGQVLGFNGFLPGWKTMTGSGPIVFTRSTYDFDCPTCVTTPRTINTSFPLSGGGDLSADRTLSIGDAAADSSTKGAATFTTNDFNSSSGNISLDYTNGQASSVSNKGFLSSADWNTFNGKMLSPMTTAGDIIYGGTGGAPTRLAGPGSGQVLGFNGFLPGWRTVTGSGPIVFTRSTYDFDCPTCYTTSGGSITGSVTASSFVSGSELRVSGNVVINSSGVLANSFGVDVAAGVAGTGFNIHGGPSGHTGSTCSAWTGGLCTAP